MKEYSSRKHGEWERQGYKETDVENIKTAEAYKTLEVILKAAYDHAATGKGKERHADGQKFEDQPIVTLEKLYHSGVLFQAAKKMHESQRLEKEAAIKELLGAINYLAARIIYLEGKE